MEPACGPASPWGRSPGKRMSRLMSDAHILLGTPKLCRFAIGARCGPEAAVPSGPYRRTPPARGGRASAADGAAAQPVHDRLRRSWRLLYFFCFEAWRHCDVPRIACGHCGKTRLPVPWVRPGSGFAADSEALTLAQCRELPGRQAAHLLRCADKHLCWSSDVLWWSLHRPTRIAGLLGGRLVKTGYRCSGLPADRQMPPAPEILRVSRRLVAVPQNQAVIAGRGNGVFRLNAGDRPALPLAVNGASRPIAAVPLSELDAPKQPLGSALRRQYRGMICEKV